MKPMMLLSLVLMSGACIPGPRKNAEQSAQSLVVSGDLQSESTLGLGKTRIYINDKPEAFYTTDGQSFSFSLSEEELKDLAKDSGQRDTPLRFYFYSDDGIEVAVSSQLRSSDRGDLKLGKIALKPQILLTGTIDALSPINGERVLLEGAEVRIGRTEAKTDAEGNFEVLAPQDASLPVRFSKSNYLLGHGQWKTQGFDDDRHFRLYQEQKPLGQMDIPDVPRNKEAQVRVLLSGTAMSRWVRIAASEAELSSPSSRVAPWMSTDDDLRLAPELFDSPSLYYQFADEDRTTLGPVQRYDVFVEAVPVK